MPRRAPPRPPCARRAAAPVRSCSADPGPGRPIGIGRAAMADLDARHPPVRMVPPNGGDPIGRVHWGDPPGLSELRWLPYVELVVMLLFVGLAAWGARSIKVSEQR